MNTYIEINENKYPALITGRLHDDDWGGRDSKSITLELSYEDACKTFTDDIEWKIIQDSQKLVDIINEETGEVIQKWEPSIDVFDNSDYCIAGDFTDHRDGKITIKMGKPTAEELLNMIVEGLSL